MLAYLLTLTPEQVKETVLVLPSEQRSLLISEFCRNVGEAVEVVLDNKEQIWEDR